MLAGQVKVHAVPPAGFTVTRNVQVAVFPAESVAVAVTVVVPIVKIEPDSG
jgi:hypothetical protein